MTETGTERRLARVKNTHFHCLCTMRSAYSIDLKQRGFSPCSNPILPRHEASGTREFNVCFALAWGEDGERINFFDTSVQIGLAIENSILNGSFLPGQRAG
jgi:hypothetical protein